MQSLAKACHALNQTGVSEHACCGVPGEDHRRRVLRIATCRNHKQSFSSIRIGLIEFFVLHHAQRKAFLEIVCPVQNTWEMDEDRFQDVGLGLVHKIHDEHNIQAKSKLRQFAWKCVCRWNKRIHLQDVLHRLTIECTVLLVYDFTGRSEAITPAQVVNVSHNVLRCVMSRCFSI